MPSRSPLETLVPRERWQPRAELRWAYCGRTQQKHGNHWFYTPHTSAWLILQGSAKVRIAGGQCSAGLGHWLITPPGERWQQTSADCKLLSICFVWQWIFGRELFPLPGAVKLASSDIPGLKTLGLRLAKKTEHLFPGSRNDLPQRSGPIEAHLELQAGLNAWLVPYGRAMRQQGIRPSLMTLDPRVEEAVQIFDRPGGTSRRPAELAKQLGVSQGQLNRLFLRDLGTTVRGHLAEQKLAAARRFLVGANLSVKEIAYQLGFLSPQHFSRWFRQHAGVSPTQLRHAPAPMI